MVTIHIVAGPHCALKTAWFNRAFHSSSNCMKLSAEQLFDRLSGDPELLFDSYLINNFENLWMDAVVRTINMVHDNYSIAVDGVTLDDQRLAYNFSYAECVQRFIDIIRDAIAKGAIRKEVSFVVHWLALPLPLRQILNHRTAHPYTTDQLRTYVYWDSEPKEPDLKSRFITQTKSSAPSMSNNHKPSLRRGLFFASRRPAERLSENCSKNFSKFRFYF